MVQIKELDPDYVSEDGFVTDPEALSDSDYDSANSSENDDDDDDDFDSLVDESLYERIVALKDVVPASTRSKISNTVANSVALAGLGFTIAGKIAWFLSTAALLIVFPLALESDKEQVMIQYEQEQQMLQQQQQQQFAAPNTSALPQQSL
ncbi:Mitochondrial import receptor subunit tom22 [Smittium culicis]|uniref:Mitochondrial import receptor subunit tom22 n=1 Tax=Smittium culicis TaxID=133412 RepID=A0A1R1Y856_9FUNG|nr:Mitochondrial import receptor subunit tom22 [Smittium culicis]OMJ14625.1 Mitochondrial import receptor subunit tom22 [Smittium culicis]OMJ22866.1 Mitochondrial import receptor subunit tom22 [Smittium culicis]